MSGSNKPDYFEEAVDDCSKKIINTRLQSPVFNVIERLSIGEILTLRLNPPTTISAINANNELAGTITNKDAAALAECMILGHKYDAEITKIDGGNCEVRIKNKR